MGATGATYMRDRSMKALDERLIERYVRFRSTLSERDVHKAEQLLASSPAAWGLADFLQGFYKGLDTLDDLNSPAPEDPPRESPPGESQRGRDAPP